MNRSIVAGSGPEVETLINEWADAGYVVESSFDGNRWWHRRIDPAFVRDVNFPINRIDLVASVYSSSPSTPATVAEWVAAGYVIDARPTGDTWINRAGQKAGAR